MSRGYCTDLALEELLAVLAVADRVQHAAVRDTRAGRFAVPGVVPTLKDVVGMNRAVRR